MSTFIFGPVVIYAENRFVARQAYEEVLARGLLDEPGGTILLDNALAVRWFNPAYKNPGGVSRDL